MREENGSASSTPASEPDRGLRFGIFIVAYNAVTTLRKVLDRIPKEAWDQVEEVYVFDDCSQDDTALLGEGYKAARGASKLHVYRNDSNLGYGGNQKRGYAYAIEKGLDYVILLHGDGQYAPEMIPEFIAQARGRHPAAVFGSRMLKKGEARRGGMPLYKYAGNRILTTFENLLLGSHLSEFHSGYRMYSTRALRRLNYPFYTDDFHFDTQVIVELLHHGFEIVEIPIPTYYGDEICYVNGMRYAKDVAFSVLQYKLHCLGLARCEWCGAGGARASRYPAKQSPLSSHQRVASLVPPNSRVLDVGAEGNYAGQLGAKGCRVTGLNTCDPGEAVRAQYERFAVRDADAGLPEPKELGTFDCVVMADVARAPQGGPGRAVSRQGPPGPPGHPHRLHGERGPLVRAPEPPAGPLQLRPEGDPGRRPRSPLHEEELQGAAHQAGVPDPPDEGHAHPLRAPGGPGSALPRLLEERGVRLLRPGPRLARALRLPVRPRGRSVEEGAVKKSLRQWHSWDWWAIGSAGFCTAASVWVRGYAYCKEDQALYLPFVLKWNTPALFPHDPLLGLRWASEAAAWHVAAVLSRFLPLQSVMLLMYLLAAALGFFFIYRTSQFLWKERWVAALTALLWVPAYTVPGSGMTTFEDYFTARVLAAGLVLGALDAWFRDRNVRTASFIFAAGLAHPITMVPAAGAIGLASLVERRWRAFAWTAAGVIAAVLGVAWLGAGKGSHSPWVRYDETWLRVVQQATPELLPDRWTASVWLGLGLLAGLFVALWAASRRENPDRLVEKRILLLFLGLLILSAVGYLGAIARAVLVTQLCLFRGWLLVIYLTILVGAGTVAGIFRRMTFGSREKQSSTATQWALGFLAAASLLALWWISAEVRVVNPPADAAIEGAMALAKTRMPVDAAVIVPPDWSEFRVRALRSPFVTFKEGGPCTYDRAYALEWAQRIHMVRGTDVTTGQRRSCMDLSREDVLAIRDAYPDRCVDYLIAPAGLSFEVLGRSGRYVLYGLKGAEAPADKGIRDVP